MAVGQERASNGRLWSVPRLGLVMDSKNTENHKSKRNFDTLIGSCFERLGGV
ncbi:MAG: hypothetical protein HEQ24_04685 [Dolichospermum sp. BR01]|nr:hypothetical protein [Dolichospermum sp. BR01]